MKKETEIIKTFEEQKNLYGSLCNKAEQLIRELINVNNITIHNLSHRTKDKDKIQEKIVRKGYKYSSLDEITDIAGIRIITFFSEDVDIVADIISKEFNVDIENTIDKRNLAEDKFGYMSMHYVVSMSSSRLKLAEYKPYKGLKFEIQIRSILQHGWAEIEHDLGYKGAKGIPSEFKRDFNRIAALLETADKEFDRLRKELASYDDKVEQDISSKQTSLSINNSTLKQFIEHSQELNQLNKSIANYYSVELESNVNNIQLGELSEKLKRNGLKTIDDLNKLLIEVKEQVILDLNNLLKYDKGMVGGVDKTVGIHILLDKYNKSS